MSDVQYIATARRSTAIIVTQLLPPTQESLVHEKRKDASPGNTKILNKRLKR